MLREPSNLERIAGNLSTTVVAVGLTAISPYALFLPSLIDSLASERHKIRVQEALKAYEAELIELKKATKELTDNQYKLVNEIVLTTLQTTEEEKIIFLKRAFKAGVRADYELAHATQLSRVLRDISAAELQFLVANFKYKSITFGVASDEADELVVNGNSPEDVIVSGLLSLSLIVPYRSSFKGLGRYRFSPLVAKLIALLQP